MAITANVLTNGGAMPPELVSEMFNAVKGHSALAKLSPEKPMGFTGVTTFTFSMDKEVDIVAETAQKTEGGGQATPITIVPIKFEYGMRASDEFIFGAEAHRIEVMERFMEGFGRKVGRGLDIGAMHGINPRTGQASTVIGTNNFVDAVSNKVVYDSTDPAGNLDSAVALVEEGINGLAVSPAFGQAMASVAVAGVPQYPEFRFGQSPANFYGMRTDVNSTVAFDNATEAIVGNFDAFRWGYGKNVDFEVIRYGDPDNTGVDLRGANEVYLRAEAYIGWGILDPDAFAIIGAGGSGSGN